MPPENHWSRCTAQRHNGNFCDAPSLPNAPFPICLKHASRVFGFIRERLRDVESSQESHLEAFSILANAKTVEQVANEVARQRVHEPLIYYVQVGDLVKIGTSTNLKARLITYPPNRRLLATEPGDYDLERHRHAEFSAYRAAGREWFAMGADLLAYINGLRRKMHAAPISAAA